MARSETARNHIFLSIPAYCFRVADVLRNPVDDALGELVLWQRADASPALFFGQPSRIDTRRQTAQCSRDGYGPLDLHGIEVGFRNRRNRVGAIPYEECPLAASRSAK